MKLEIPENHELRFEVGEYPVKIKVLSGNCEIKGEELLLNKQYEFENTKSFIFAHYSSEVLVEGEFTAHYITDNTNVLQILRLFRLCLQHDVQPNFKFTSNNLKESINKKTFVVLGNGKSTFIQTITNYLVRMGKNVLISDLNLKTGFLVFPGNISCMLCTKIVSCLPDTIPDNSLTYFFGSTNVKYNSELYKRIINNLGNAVEKKEYDFHFVLANEEVLPYIKEIDAFTGCYVVLKDEKLFNKVDNTRIFISNGAYETKPDYFHFLNTKNYSKYNIKLWSRVVRVGEEFIAPESALPIGADRKIDVNVVTTVTPRKNMILAASYAENEEDILDSPVKSFVVVNEVGDGFIKAQSLQPSLKANFLIQGEITN